MTSPLQPINECGRPLVSIIMPCFNAERYVAAAIESALRQDWPNKEIILVNDGSNDRSLEIARIFETRGVRVVDQPNQGASAARNRGLQLSRGDFLQFLDADDLLAPGKISRQMGLAGCTDGDFALCSCWSRFRETTADADHTRQPLCRDADPVDWIVDKFERNLMMHPAAWLIPRGLAERAGPWNEELTLDDDGEYFSRIVLSSRGVRCAFDGMSYYRSGVSGSLSGRKSEKAWASAFLSIELSSQRLLEAENSPRTRKACATALQQFVYDSYPQSAECRAKAREMIARLGGSDLQPSGGPRFKLVQRFLGWRVARRLQRLFQ